MENVLNGFPAVPVIIATVILTLLGNAIWDYLAKPSMAKLRNIALSVATLGIKSAQNKVYKKVGLAITEQPTGIYIAVNSAVIVAAVLFGMYHFAHIRGYEQVIEIHERVKKSHDRIVGNLPESEEKISEEEKAIMVKELLTETSALKEKMMSTLSFLKWSSLLILAFIVIDLAVIVYAQTAGSYIRQMLVTIRPGISQDVALQLRAEASQITTRSDFVKVLSQIYKFGEMQSLKFERFNPW